MGLTMSADDISGEFKSLTVEEVERYKVAFKAIDKDQGGTIDREEAKEYMKKLSLAILGNPPPEDVWHQRLNKEVNDMFNKMDANHDEQISFEEYLECHNTAKELQAARAAGESA